MLPFFVRVLIGILAITTASRAIRAQARIEPIGVLPGGFSFSNAVDISADGETVVGYCSTPSYNSQAFQWSYDGGIEALPGLTPGVDEQSDAFAVSADGSVIVGRVYPKAGGANSTAVRWLNGVPSTLVAGSSAHAVDVSWDGSVVAVYSNGCGFLWTEKTGVQAIPIPPGYSGICCEARAISGDGTTIVGLCGTWGYRWSQSTGPQALIYPPDRQTAAHGVSYDGQVVFGNWIGPTSRGFRWTASAGFEDLGQLPDQASAMNVTGCSSNGSVAVGDYHAVDGQYAFVWSETLGLQRLRDLVPDLGSYPGLCGWHVGVANAVSSDGTRIVGHATYADDAFPDGTQFGAYIAYLAEAPESCCDGCDDGDASTSDSCVDGLCAHTPILYGDLYPCGGDGIIDVDDILAVLDAFAGVPQCTGGR